MIEIGSDALHRHLGLPPGVPMDDATRELAGRSRQWYLEHGEPWSRASTRDIVEISGDDVRLASGGVLSSRLLARGLAEVDAHALAIVGVSAGVRVDEQVDHLWSNDRPDEAMFLNAYAVAVAEHLRECEVGRQGNEFREHGMTVLPHYSPGYEGWDLADQRTVFDSLSDHGPLELLSSGCLRPVRSTLAVVGVTRRPDLRDLQGFWFRQPDRNENARPADDATYVFPKRALAKWARERLTIMPGSNGDMTARFRFDGTTCSSMGMPFSIDYNATLSRDDNGSFRVVDCCCVPAEGDTGHRAMCAYLSDADHLMSTLRSERPLCDQPLDAALQCPADTCTGGCLCLQAYRDHKWRIVLQTIHFALNTREHSRPDF